MESSEPKLFSFILAKILSTIHIFDIIGTLKNKNEIINVSSTSVRYRTVAMCIDSNIRSQTNEEINNIYHFKHSISIYIV